MQHPEAISQAVSEELKQKLKQALQVYLSANNQENEQNLDKLVATLLFIRNPEVRVKIFRIDR